MNVHLDNRTARRLILFLQGLSDPPDRRRTTDELAALVERLGYVQLDSIRWVERAHDMILNARCTAARPGTLQRLVEHERALFEHWTHDACVIPCAFYPFWRHRFERTRERLATKFAAWQGEGYATHLAPLKERVLGQGRLRSRDLDIAPGERPTDMWQWHDGKAALEYLWRTGELAIVAREGFQKVYGAVEEAVPAPDREVRVGHDAFVDFACRAALERLGIATPGTIARYFDLVTPAEAKAWAAEQGGNTLVPVTVEGADGAARSMLARADVASLAAHLPAPPPRIRALSPFDPVIRDRDRLSWLFGFDYRIEIYVPAAKRVWGYYVFPLLEGDRLVGRIDMRADRRRDVLAVRRVWWEPGVRRSGARSERLARELARMARFAGVSDVVREDLGEAGG